MIERALLVLCALIPLTACIDSTTTISIRKDGTGIITETRYFDESVMVMLKSMMEQVVGKEGQSKEQRVDSLVDFEKCERKAENMGMGVTCVSAQGVKDTDGTAGIEAVYSFEDIRQLNLSLMPEHPMGDKLAGTMGFESEKDEDLITFDFRKGTTPTLIVNIPKKKEPGRSEEKPGEGKAGKEVDPARMGMMKQMFQGFRIRLLVNPLEGKIARTNAAFVERVAGGETVTLFDINFGEMMSNEKYMKEFRDLDKIKDMNVALERMKNIPGLKIETSGRVEISFR